ncbi:hypothetical protein LG324_05395 [Phycicoccus jejuensis]|uniref:hypothetical protein n=1 Tax=Phycicoccus jejuensis TaxID=367299 RepID=UPI00384BD72D
MRRWTTGFFIVPFLGLVAAGGIGPHVSASPALTLASIVGLGIGLMWQLVDRKDIADRLTWLSVLFAIGAFLQFLSGVTSGSVALHLPALFFGFGVTSSVVLAEAYLRRRDRSRGPTGGDALRLNAKHSDR